MAIITKGSNLEKGNEVEFTLNITDLLAHASVSGDAYFSDQSNWDKVFINYGSQGHQKEILIFKNVDSGATSTANFGVFSGARDAFEVQSIIIMDKQGGYLHVKRSDLVVADFDVDFSASSPTSGGGGSIAATYTAFDYLSVLRGDPNNPLDGSDNFGWSVSISGDYIVVGAESDGGVDNAASLSGAAYVYKINQDNTVTLLDTLRGDPIDSYDQFGYSVSISNGYIVVGAPTDDGVGNAAWDSGAAYVYKINQDDTITLLDTLRGDPNNPLDGSDNFGSSVSISGDYIVVSARADDACR